MPAPDEFLKAAKDALGEGNYSIDTAGTTLTITQSLELRHPLTIPDGVCLAMGEGRIITILGDKKLRISGSFEGPGEVPPDRSANSGTGKQVARAFDDQTGNCAVEFGGPPRVVYPGHPGIPSYFTFMASPSFFSASSANSGENNVWMDSTDGTCKAYRIDDDHFVEQRRS
jgi:hypothetical protein